MKNVQCNLLLMACMLMGMITSPLQGANGYQKSCIQEYGHPVVAGLALLGSLYALLWGYKKMQDGYRHYTDLLKWSSEISLKKIAMRSRWSVAKEAACTEEALQKFLNSTGGNLQTNQGSETGIKLQIELSEKKQILDIQEKGAFPYSILSFMLGSVGTLCSLLSIHLFFSSK